MSGARNSAVIEGLAIQQLVPVHPFFPNVFFMRLFAPFTLRGLLAVTIEFSSICCVVLLDNVSGKNGSYVKDLGEKFSFFPRIFCKFLQYFATCRQEKNWPRMSP